jgi:predicted MFS family arabinose efflux permease
VTGGSRRRLGLVALTIGVAIIIVDAAIVNVAIPSIIRDLGIGITQAERANSIYSLVFAALLISVGGSARSAAGAACSSSASSSSLRRAS